MPTPSTEDLPSVIHRSVHATCPPDDDRPMTHMQLPSAITEDGDDGEEREDGEDSASPESSTDNDVAESPAPTDGPSITSQQDSDADVEIPQNIPIPMSPIEEPSKVDAPPFPTSTSPAPTSLAPAFHNSETSSSKCVPKYSSSFLRPGSKFEGTQQSDRQVYNVQVEIKHVDMSESFVCGYLHIEGLTADHPTLTTYFEGEIIGTKYSFLTSHSEWGSNEKVDMQHWNRFPAWKPLQRQARKQDFNYKNYAEREHLFMRWKEYFLVPDHKVRTISGASFEGFYYICFNQVSGTVSGIYFHSKSEKFQQLELKHVEDHGCLGAMEFR